MGSADADGVAEEIEQAGHEQSGHPEEVAFQLVLAEPVDLFHGAGTHKTADGPAPPAASDVEANQNKVREDDGHVVNPGQKDPARSE